MAQYKLIYFNGRGLGEIIRYIFIAADVPFEDVRISREEWRQWPDLKPSIASPMGQLPVVETEGLRLFQSLSISRYLARKFGLAGKTEVDQFKVDSIVDSIEDMGRPIIQFYIIEKDETKKAELKKIYIEETFPKFLSNLEKLLKTNNHGDGYFVGDGLTWADLYFMNFIDRISFAGLEFPSDKYPKLNALFERVRGQPNIAEYIAKRPETEF